MNEKKRVLKETNCLFQQPWWLEAVVPGAWDAVVAEHAGRVVGRLPFVIKRRHGFTYISMPPLTQTLGPWIEPKEAKYPKVLAWQKDVMNELIERLPAFNMFWQNFHYEVTNWLPFYWQGFEQTTRYTYLLSDISDHGRIWDGLMENIRREIKKAARQVCVRTDLGLDRFLEINEKTFLRPGMRIPIFRMNLCTGSTTPAATTTEGSFSPRTERGGFMPRFTSSGMTARRTISWAAATRSYETAARQAC